MIDKNSIHNKFQTGYTIVYVVNNDNTCQCVATNDDRKSISNKNSSQPPSSKGKEMRCTMSR